MAAKVDPLAAEFAAFMEWKKAQSATPPLPPLAPVAGRVFEGHIGPSGKHDGRRFMCAVDVACTKLTRSLEASQSHDARSGAFHVAEIATK